MKRTFPTEFLYQVFALIIAVIVVHAVYVTVVRPRATEVMAEQTLRIQEEENYTAERSIWVLIRDFEQESCFVLMIWAFSIMGFKATTSLSERALLQRELIPVPDGVRILPEDSREYARTIQALPDRMRGMLLPRVLLSSLERFGSTRNVQDVSSVANTLCESEGERLESELSMIRYIAWAIPSVGFIGTVRGIGDALGQAHRAVDGDIAGVTQSLGTAFNSTFIALLISIVVMFLVHQLQLLQERLVFDTQTYIDHNLIRHMQARD
ncbi:MAG: MotA/TolQ/ExbB proton channel family protein [Gammaproteobacteria bacterium]|nr:MotA/TolQ/ExbB proton channel family protein [Gammaproteobacteria bacterium]MDH3506920.1 MotA/TolQ/ExbB proton channel family protein [Gammaproteobacteria bacterium]